jgi:sugar lactone lactonase YvrE
MLAKALFFFVVAVAAQAQQPPPFPEKMTPYPVVGDITFAEGPAFDQKGNLYFVNYLRGGTIGRKTPDGTVSVWCETGGRANGLKVDKEGYIIAADEGGRRILRIHPDGKQITVLADNYQGEKFLGPNDVCLDLAGNVYFTDPKGSTREKWIGGLYRIDRNRQVRRLAAGLAFPNGLAVSPDQKRLYVVEEWRGRLVAYDLGPDGTVGPEQEIYRFPAPGMDGIAFDEYGRLWATRFQSGTVEVLTQDGQLLKTIPAGGTNVTNICFWGKSVYLTVAGSHSIHRIDAGVGGAPQWK